jgi:hypothetical protein
MPWGCHSSFPANSHPQLHIPKSFPDTAPPCGPGFYVNGGVCTVCGFGFYCPDGTARLPCGTGETTVTDTSTVESQCVKECTTDAGVGLQEESAIAETFVIALMGVPAGVLLRGHIESGNPAASCALAVHCADLSPCHAPVVNPSHRSLPTTRLPPQTAQRVWAARTAPAACASPATTPAPLPPPAALSAALASTAPMARTATPAAAERPPPPPPPRATPSVCLAARPTQVRGLQEERVPWLSSASNVRCARGFFP